MVYGWRARSPTWMLCASDEPEYLPRTCRNAAFARSAIWGSACSVSLEARPLLRLVGRSFHSPKPSIESTPLHNMNPALHNFVRGPKVNRKNHADLRGREPEYRRLFGADL